jgi:hypothetical protein|tara:strand:+ start:820 stop:1176 length:357 start_codon:yes stop_codon:yes gene_type:complete
MDPAIIAEKLQKYLNENAEELGLLGWEELKNLIETFWMPLPNDFKTYVCQEYFPFEKRSVIYELVKNDRRIYIGWTQNLPKAIKTHDLDFDRVFYHDCPSKDAKKTLKLMKKVFRCYH